VLFFFTLFYGYLQELVSIHIFAREFGLFVTFLQFCGYAFFAFLQWIAREHKRQTVPMEYCVALAVLQSSMQGLSNLSMRYLNYPAKVLFKSSRVLPTMFFGVVLYGKRHTRREYASVCVLVVGLVIFMIADARKSPDFNPIGVALIATSLVVDAAVSNLQEYIFSMFNTDEEELVFTSYAGGSLVLFLLCMATVSSTSLLWPFGLRTRYFLESAMRTTFLHGS
jgi:adenosine 3'-phospho 5'-phosphosulfate transporter B3